MKKSSAVIIGLVAVTITLWGCDGAAEKGGSQKEAAKSPVVEAPAAQFSGTVLETMDSGGYTYVKVDIGKEQIWAAGPSTPVKVGDKVSIPAGMPMHNFHSKTLNRDFEVVYFVGAILDEAGNAPAADMGLTPPGHSPMMGGGMSAPQEAPVEVGLIKKAEGGKTVAEVFQEKEKLAGKKVTIRAKVVKFTPEIMDKNWFHIQDGTGAAGSNDLTVTTSQTLEKGKTVVVTGTLAVDKDFGYGYRYDVIIEDAQVTVE